MKMKDNAVDAGGMVLDDRQGAKQAIALGLVLSASNFGTGIGAGIADLDLGWASCCNFLSSLAAMGGGAMLGKMMTQNFSCDRLLQLAEDFDEPEILQLMQKFQQHL